MAQYRTETVIEESLTRADCLADAVHDYVADFVNALGAENLRRQLKQLNCGGYNTAVCVQTRLPIGVVTNALQILSAPQQFHDDFR